MEIQQQKMSDDSYSLVELGRIDQKASIGASLTKVSGARAHVAANFGRRHQLSSE